MKLKRIRLHPFAGLADRTYEFVPGMNVVLGPNEAGKSTIVNGILCALFESTSYGKIHGQKNLQRFVPRGGGDTFGVSLDCLVGGESYQIKKSWGGECRCELTLPSGQVIRNSDDMDRNVASLLQLKRGTWQNILIAHQSSISSTLKDFDKDGEEASDLAQILRGSAFETDGVSIEKLERVISKQLSALSLRWDLNADRPEKDKGKERGIEHPWKNDVGTLLKAWYEHERLKNTLLEIETYERNLDTVNQQVSELIAERDELQLYVDKYGPIVNALKEQQGLALKLDAAQKNEIRLREIQSKWPLHESEISRLENSLKELEDAHGVLQKELSGAYAYQKSESKREKLKSAKKAEEKFGEVQATFAEFKDLSTQLFQDLKAAIGERDRYAASMAAGKLQVRFVPESDTKVNIKAGLEDSREEMVTNAQPLYTEADGIVSLTTDQFKFEVESGDGQFSAIKEKHESAQTRISNMLSTIGVASVVEANKRETDYLNAKTNLERAKTALKTILDGQVLAELERASGDEVPAPKREIKEINDAILATGTLDPWMQRLSQTIQQVTSDRYMDLDFDGGGVTRSSGINTRIREHVGRDARNLQIGHSYLMQSGSPLKDLASLKRAVRDDIIPLLEEYCYEDYTTLATILGDQLVDSTAQRICHELFDDGSESDLIEALLAPCPEITASSEAVSSEESLSESDDADGGEGDDEADEQ